MDPAATSMMLGKYRLLAELGRGGMSKVYLAMARGPAGFNKLVVIKQIRAHLSEDPDFVTMFLDEARLAARLNHPNVVQTNEVGQEDETYFIAMEYLEGQTLNRILTKIGPQLGLAIQLRTMSEALRGLHYAHELKDFDGTPLGVVHRDVSPHNVIVTYSGEVKVVDFGIAKALNSSTETQTGVIKGKVAYMAPEQAMADKVDRRADVFSAGVCLWQIAAGVRMFRGQADVVIIQRLMSGDIPAIRDHAPDIDPAFEAIIQKALAPNKEDRYATADELRKAVDAFAETLSDRRGPRDLGQILGEVFASDRQRITSVVEEQMKLAPESVARLPSIDAPVTEASQPSHGGTGTSPSGTGSGPNSSRSLVSISSSSATPEGTAAITVHSTHVSAIGPARSRRPLFAIAAGAGALIAVLAFFFLRGRTPGAQGAPTPTDTAAVPSYTLRISSTPPGATVREGDHVLGQTPLSITVPSGSPPRSFVALMDGYEAKTLDAPALTGDMMLEASLVPTRHADPQGVATATASASASTPKRPYAVGRPPPPVQTQIETTPPPDIRLKR